MQTSVFWCNFTRHKTFVDGVYYYTCVRVGTYWRGGRARVRVERLMGVARSMVRRIRRQTTPTLRRNRKQICEHTSQTLNLYKTIRQVSLSIYCTKYCPSIVDNRHSSGSLYYQLILSLNSWQTLYNRHSSGSLYYQYCPSIVDRHCITDTAQAHFTINTVPQ